MVRNKRPVEDGAGADLDDVHPSRKKRVKYTEEDAQLAKIYHDLADEVQAVRIKAAGDLLRIVSAEPSKQAARLDANGVKINSWPL